MNETKLWLKKSNVTWNVFKNKIENLYIIYKKKKSQNL